MMRRREEEYSRRWSASELKDRAMRRFAALLGDKQPCERYAYLIDAFARYFAGEAGPLNPAKGIILSGCTGCGKTTLFKAFNFGTVFQCDRPKKSLTADNALLFGAARCTDVADTYAEHGPQGLKRYYGGNMMFDDLGVEAVGVNFGSRENVMARVIQERYDRNGLTFLTTNLDYKGIQQAYGERVASRLAEMCSWVDMGINEDYRR